MFRSNFHRLIRLATLVVCVAFAVSVLAPSALAGPPPCKGKNRDNPGCGGGGSGAPPSAGNASAELFDTTSGYGNPDYYDLGGAGGHTNTAASGNCETPPSGNTAASGQYACTEVGDLAFSTLEMSSWLYNKKYRKICGSFSLEDLTFPVSLLRFGWNDDCTDDGTCSVDATVNPDSAVVSALTDGAADAVDLIFNGTLTGYASAETNPFAEGATGFDVTSIDLVFMNTGSGRVVGVCTANPHPGIEFASVPN